LQQLKTAVLGVLTLPWVGLQLANPGWVTGRVAGWLLLLPATQQHIPLLLNQLGKATGKRTNAGQWWWWWRRRGAVAGAYLDSAQPN